MKGSRLDGIAEQLHTRLTWQRMMLVTVVWQHPSSHVTLFVCCVIFYMCLFVQVYFMRFNVHYLSFPVCCLLAWFLIVCMYSICGIFIFSLFYRLMIWVWCEFDWTLPAGHCTHYTTMLHCWTLTPVGDWISPHSLPSVHPHNAFLIR